METIHGMQLLPRHGVQVEMPFSEVSVVQSRLSFVLSVLVEGLSVSVACRRFGVSRSTGYKWLERYAEDSVAGLSDRSRRPHTSPTKVPLSVEQSVLELKHKYPVWSGKKLSVLLGQSSPSPRTVDRILERHGLTAKEKRHAKVGRFQRENCNELWQLDHKGVPKGHLPIFGCVDDASRFCIVLETVKDQSLNAFWEPLWDAFGTYGLPDAILCDNGPAFKNLGMWRCSTFELRLMLLGIKPMHGRPYHPQTQGKVERFFKTLEQEMKDDIAEFRETYNTIRPHESLQQATPAAVYVPSARARPRELPPIILPEKSIKRKTTQQGAFSYKGRHYNLGKAVKNTTIGIIDEDIYYGPIIIGTLSKYEI